jgi:hypothetical protein
MTFTLEDSTLGRSRASSFSNPREGMMTHYFVSYDLNGSTPTHAQMDKHIVAFSSQSARVLETVWYVASNRTAKELYDHVNSLLSINDRLLIIEANAARYRNLLDTTVIDRNWK